METVGYRLIQNMTFLPGMVNFKYQNDTDMNYFVISGTEKKFLNQLQHSYKRKNWSSVMLFNCEKCTELTPEYVNTASAADLHELNWAHHIGALPEKFNHLVDEQPLCHATVLHYTLGTPGYHDCTNSEYSNLWLKYAQYAT